MYKCRHGHTHVHADGAGTNGLVQLTTTIPAF